jgi:predicted nucleotidyltransferase
MVATPHQKEKIKRDLAACLGREKEVRKVVIFGSFLTSATPNDLDVAVFQDSDESYLPLAMKYRRLLRPIADQIPIDVIPVRSSGACGQFLTEIQKGEVVYERSGLGTKRSHGRYV